MICDSGIRWSNASRMCARTDPGGTPAIHRGIVGAEVVPQGLENAPVVDRVHVAADDGGERTHTGTSLRVGGQQGRARVALFEPLDDRW
jgi:hypothetical protein